MTQIQNTWQQHGIVAWYRSDFLRILLLCAQLRQQGRGGEMRIEKLDRVVAYMEDLDESTGRRGRTAR